MVSVLEQTRAEPNRLVLYGVSWETYERVLEAFSERRLRITFDRGDLEIMTISPKHEWFKNLIRRLVDIVIEELFLPVCCLGSLTFKRKSKKRGLEPDECYWIFDEPIMRGITEYDPETDPPPDLVLEIDVTSSSLNRIAIYEVLRVGEVWRWVNDEIEIRALDKHGKLKQRKTSSLFPGLKIADLVPFLEMATAQGQAEMVQAFRKWVREQIEAGRIRRPELPDVENNGKK